MTSPAAGPVGAFLAEVRERIGKVHASPAPTPAMRLAAEDAPVLAAALEAVLAIHQDDSYGRCMVCREFCDCFDPPAVPDTVEGWGRAAMDCPHGNEPWPCRTAKAIESALRDAQDGAG